jgi:carbamoyltransferase
MTISNNMHILGISAFYHDSAACLVKDGGIAAAVQEERFTRKKHDSSFPVRAIRYCLEKEGISGSDLDLVAFYDKPFLKFERILETYMAFAPLGIRSFLKAIPLWIKKKLWIKDLIKNELQYSGTIIFTEHHQAHAASAFFPSPFQQAAFITMDGVGEWSTTSFGMGLNNRIQLMADIRFPHSLGLLYSAFTYYTGFRVNSGEYKVMGLAPYGEPRYKDLIYRHLIDVKDDGSFMLNLDYFDYCAGLTMTNDKFNALFGGPPRRPESELTRKEMDLACSVQKVTEEIVMKMAGHVKKETSMKQLCLAGGVALNCVANGKLLRENLFDDIWIQPAAGDAGGAVGAALFAWHMYLDNPRNTDGQTDAMRGAYLGPEYANDRIEYFLNQNQIPFLKMDDDHLFDQVADLIAAEKVIGWFRGKMEFGPRALGTRSIIGDARSARMQSRINLKIKYRESFRPFAPSVLEEAVSDYFELDRVSPYMLLVAKVKQDKRIAMTQKQKQQFGIARLNAVRSTMPAITHVDYSARIHSVSRKTNPAYHRLLDRFNEKYDCPVIVNTSFNVRGEPIVCTPEDAFRCFMRTEMDYLVMGNCLLDKSRQQKQTHESSRPETFEPD